MSARSGRWQVVVAVAALRSCMAGLVALVPARFVGEIVGRHPLGDAVLWEPGGRWLSEVAGRASGVGGPSPLRVATVAFVGLVTWSVPLAALVSSRGARPPDGWRSLASGALRTVGRYTAVGAMCLVAQAVLVAFLAALVGFASRPFVAVASAEVPFAVGAAAGASFAFVLGVLGDLARCRVSWSDAGVFAAIAAAWGTLRGDARGLLGAALSRGLVTVLGLGALGAMLVATLPSSGAVPPVVAIAAAFVAVLGRASWLDAVARRVRR